MIGVVARTNEIRAVEEFFQLFKTAWEFYVPSRDYETVIVAEPEASIEPNASLVVIYGSASTALDEEAGMTVGSRAKSQSLRYGEFGLPLYGHVSSVCGTGDSVLCSSEDTETIARGTICGESRIVRLGYDLFQEVAYLLTKGQPPENAAIPTLEFHIALLRSLMVNAGLGFVEILPMPHGCDFMACLTHDVDFTGIREHKFDATMFGFVYRALFGSIVNAFKGRISWANCRANWSAVFSLPLVYAGIKDDFWLEFDRYKAIEKDLGSTFFFIPFKGYAGTQGLNPAPKRRAAKYDLAELNETLPELVNNGCEVGLHGLDAWQDREKARSERAKISAVSGDTTVGVRMHWLYFSEDSPRVLEAAGLLYDSTFGYNDAVGFRAGTSQVFCPPQAESLLELPLSIQDTALFYPDRMDLSARDAIQACERIIDQAVKFGGVVTVNWHTRSLSPERLWGEFYESLLEAMKKHRVWFGTARQAVDWFRVRRSIRFERVEDKAGSLRVKLDQPMTVKCPFVIRVYRGPEDPSVDRKSISPEPSSTDIPWNGDAEWLLDMNSCTAECDTI